MKFKHILPFLAAALLALLCGCDADTPVAPPETDSPTADGSEAVTEPHTHVYGIAVTPPTCETEGYTRYTCGCGYTYDSDHTPPVGHTFDQTVIPPACETEGYTRYTCGCGYTYDSDHIPPVGHTFTETVILPACETEGYTRHACACGYAFDTAHVPPKGHDYTATVTPPTCVEEGYTHFQCTACGHGYDTDRTAPLNHANATAERFYPTVSRDGYTRHTCPDCGYSFDDGFVKYTDIVTGAYADGTEILMQGVDTSKWNHEYGVSPEDIKPLDFEALKAAGMEFVILKAGSSKGIDPAFEMDYLHAKAAGLQVGAYFYTYSATVEDTARDVEMLLNWLAGKQFELPIYFDAEDSTLMGLGQETLTALCMTFAEGLQEAGYYAALYTNTEWLYNLLDTETVKSALDIWYARYTATPPEGQETFAPTDRDFAWKDGTAYKPGEPDRRYGLWQYTDRGGIEGFRYRFDFNFAFKDYRAVMLRWGLNGFPVQEPLPAPADGAV